ncbi:hypothetical protein [Kitasatospora sp. KL5]|uniref:hypothetical protein n=1 Tax=Kitasatospora sp. KL5 TaxID=3425125 RepID=UPI003D6FC3A9
MKLRPELLPPPVPAERLRELSAAIERIGDLVLGGRRTEAAAAIAAFNERTGHTYRAADFAEYEGWRSLEEFAREAARPAWPRVPDLTRDEAVELVRRVQAGGPDAEYCLRLLSASLPHPGIGDLVFHPSAGVGDSAEAVVDAALAYRPIAL